MGSEWKEVSLGDASISIQTGPFGSQLHKSDYVTEGIPSIMPVNISDNRITTDGIARITEADAQRLSKYLVITGDIVYSRRGDVERRALVRERENGWLCGTGCLRVRFDHNLVDSEYASFQLGSPFAREWIVRHAVGATMPNLNTSILSALPFILPPLPEQKAIAHILGSLDDKIELNRRMNATLEGMAQALFQSWFVDFDPVLDNALAAGNPIPAELADRAAVRRQALDNGTANREAAQHFPDTFQLTEELGWIPEGWEVSTISDLFELHRGYDLSTKKRIPGPFPVYAAGGIHGTHNEAKMDPPGIITGRSGVIGNVFLSLTPYWPLNTTLYIREFRKSGPFFALHFLKQLDLKVYNSGSAVPSLNRNHVHSSDTLIPPSNVLEEYETFVESLFVKIKANDELVDSLTKLRDTLLPQLISGEQQIEVANLIAREDE